MSALARIKKTAAQHEQERQYDKALALYARLLDGAEAGDEEVDVALFNRAGDLALRLSDAPRAVGYFERALDLYAAAGLLNNAVALGVKILRHAPHHLSAHYTLGVLYGRKGFVGDARHHLLTYAVQMQRAGRADETTRVLAEVAATCADVAELRAAYDAYSALGGDPAHAAPLAGGQVPATVVSPAAAPSAAPPVAEPAFLDLAMPEPVVAGGPSATSVALVDARPTPPAPAFEFLDVGPVDTGVADVAPLVLAPALDEVLVDDVWGENRSFDDGLLDHGPLDHVALDHVALDPLSTAAATDAEAAAGPDLTFLDVHDEEPAGAPQAFAAPAADTPRQTPVLPAELPNEPPPLCLADLADVAGRRPAPAAWADPAPEPAPAPGRFADLLAAELADIGAVPPPADRVPPRAPAAASPDDDGLDLGAWLRETTPEESTRMTTADVAQSGDEQADFDATLRIFTDGVARAVGHEDFDSHYDLGVAFREMGLLDEAIVQFQRAAQAPGRPLRALEALAQCFLDADQPELALSTLAAPVAAAEAVGDASLVGVHYLMGAAAQALDRPDDARRWLVRVVATDVRFRDASCRLAALSPPAPTR